MEPQREWFEKDYYAVLGVASDASERDIKRAYKDLARKLHPDQNPGDKAAEERFKDVATAYDVLGDGEKKAAYDDVRQMVATGYGPGRGRQGTSGGFDFSGFEGGGGGGFDDLFGGLFGGGGGGRRPRGGPERGRDLETELHLEFADAAHGITTTVRFTADAVCSTCNGAGSAPGTTAARCGQCNGTGNQAVNQGPFSFSQVCAACGGRGSIITDPCGTCRGRGVEVRPREVKVRIPAGVSDGQRIRVKERGAAGLRGGPSGDLFVVVHVRPHELFGRRGNDLTVRRPISFSMAALGGDLKVPTLEGATVTIRIPPGTPSGKTLRVPGKGLAGGALLVTVDVEIPTTLTAAQRRAVEALGSVFDTDGGNADAPPTDAPPTDEHDAGARPDKPPADRRKRRVDGAA